MSRHWCSPGYAEAIHLELGSKSIQGCDEVLITACYKTWGLGDVAEQRSGFHLCLLLPHIPAFGESPRRQPCPMEEMQDAHPQECPNSPGAVELVLLEAGSSWRPPPQGSTSPCKCPFLIPKESASPPPSSKGGQDWTAHSEPNTHLDSAVYHPTLSSQLTPTNYTF